MADQSSKPDRARPYGRAPRRPDNWKVQTVLPGDAGAAVRQVMAAHNLSASGAVHHLVRLGAGLPPLL